MSIHIVKQLKTTKQLANRFTFFDLEYQAAQARDFCLSFTLIIIFAIVPYLVWVARYYA